VTLRPAALRPAALRPAALVLADGSAFEGEWFGAAPDTATSPICSGEVVFNTVLAGYQEVITDPSYAGQIITFTYPHIGNYGVSTIDFEARRPFCRGVIVRDLARRHSNYRAEASLDAMLATYGIGGIAGVDTRRLARLLRDTGAMPGAFGPTDTVSEVDLRAAAASEPGTDGVDLVAEVTIPTAYDVATASGNAAGDNERLIVAYDFGLKQAILRNLATLGRVRVVPAHTTAAEVMALQPAGVFLSNGPGDPSLVTYGINAIEGLLGQVPIFGICLGHQLLSRAIGGTTFKLPFGHHGGNHPVRHEPTGKIEITSQNHNFCVDPLSITDRAEVTHVNLNDMTVEGLRVRDVPAFSVQYHPEAGPGPHDARYLFAMFDELMAANGSPGKVRPLDDTAQLIAPERGAA
jgi:carbamoyl-phosphate synthase small subunit